MNNLRRYLSRWTPVIVIVLLLVVGVWYFTDIPGYLVRSAFLLVLFGSVFAESMQWMLVIGIEECLMSFLEGDELFPVFYVSVGIVGAFIQFANIGLGGVDLVLQVVVFGFAVVSMLSSFLFARRFS